jgi:hypothetical protein
MTKPTTADYIHEYLVRMGEIRGTGAATKETSYYGALENLLNHFGHDLRPSVICNGQLKNQGAGNPDFGLYTKAQIQGGEPRPGQTPERGVIEVKGLADNTWQTAKSAQATKYFDHYRLVLITNYREFRLIGEDESGKAKELERYTLATDEASFWVMTSKPLPAVHAHAVHFEEFLRRVMMTAAPLVKADDVAWFLASYARDALQTLNNRDTDALDTLRIALETALGIHFEGREGEHFFRSTLVQTLFYGVFSAWVVYVKQSTARFDWRAAAYIPLPNSGDRLNASAELGSKLVALLDPAVGVAGINEGNLQSHLKILGVLSSTNLTVDANWGRLDKLGKVFPGRGKVKQRAYTVTESEALAKGADELGIDKARLVELLGPPLDIYLNDVNFWTCVPTNVWDYFIGGYQVIKKWLSYREENIMGRPLSKDEAREVTAMVRRIASIVLMADELDSNYVSAKDNAFPWPLNTG